MPTLTALVAEPWDQGNDFFDPTSLQISTIRAGQRVTNVIPGSVEVLFNLRFSTEVTADEIRERCEAILDQGGLTYDIDWSLSGEPFLTEPGALLNAVIGSIEATTGPRAGGIHRRRHLRWPIHCAQRRTGRRGGSRQRDHSPN
ncbi:MAG: hypothetical protein CM15mP92_1550 [Halieaceae bacterium]|nr:MAG: hypothetical protein CM15mP92_1550 [Halieaceae bacterium]